LQKPLLEGKVALSQISVSPPDAMTRPFIPLPIFPPYSHWRPKSATSFPGNLQVSERLSKVNNLSQPFISTWYADRFINWIAHNCIR
jgi:hypothetical protein